MDEGNKQSQPAIGSGAEPLRLDIAINHAGVATAFPADKATEKFLVENKAKKVSLYTHPAPTAQDSKVPEGWKLVPDVPTENMLEEGLISLNAGRALAKNQEQIVSNIFEDMLSAAPSLAERPAHTEQPLAMVAEKPKQGEEWTVSVYQHHAENYPRVSLHAPDSGIFSDWFDDVALTISGNFESGEKKIQCADAICAALNFTGNAHPVPEKLQNNLESVLQRIGNIAHHGGLIGFARQDDAMNEIRKLTLPYWDGAECDRLQRPQPPEQE